VTLTITQGSKQIFKQVKTIPFINSKATTVVTFRNIQVTQFGSATQVKVDVAPVPNEHNLTNNTATYPVIFSLPTQ
jgi:hypothetical protein